MGGWVDGWMDGWVDGWNEQWMGWMGGELDNWKGYLLGVGGGKEQLMGTVVYQIPRAAETKYHQFGGLKQQKFIVSEFWSSGIQIQGVGRCCLSEGSRGGYFLVSPSLQLLPANLGIPW